MKFKKLCCVALAVSMLTTSSAMLTANAEETAGGRLGDVNLDCKITVEDMVALNSQAYTCSDDKLLKIADINGDGAVDSADVDRFVDDYIWAYYNLGDINGDGKVSIDDATEIQKYIVNMVDDFDFVHTLITDFNQDGIINIDDATEIQKYIVGLGTHAFATDKVKAVDAKYRGTYDSKTGKYEGGEYSDTINYIEETTNISFEQLLKNDVYVVKAPNGWSTFPGCSVWVRDENWCYEIAPESGQIWLWGCYSNNETMVIPTSLAGYKIYDVENWFSVKEEFPNYPTEQSTIDSIKTLIIPNDKDSNPRYDNNGYWLDDTIGFGSGCFEGMKNLETVVLQEGISVSQFSGNVFKSCENLKNIIWPDSLTDVPAGLFWNCKSITSIQQLHLPTTVNEIQENAFCGSGLKEITIPENIRTIKGWAFKNVPARTVTFLYEKMVNYDFEPYIFNMSGSFLGEKYTFYGYSNSSYESIKRDVMNIYNPKNDHVLPSFNYISE